MRLLRRVFREECEAADMPCWMCTRVIDYDAAHDDYANESRFQLDHFFPVSTHPDWAEDPANFRASHAGCNLERGNRAPRGGLGSLSREWV
jgi:5-methylcytosine-specific restriction endonuclease McrA